MGDPARGGGPGPDGDGRLSREEFAELWLEFWAGDDIEAAGTYVFGPV